MADDDDGWDMSPRREGQVMSDLPAPAEPADPERFLMTARGKLSPAEIEALLRPDLSDMGPEPEPPPPKAAPAERALGDFAAPPAPAAAAEEGTARRLAARLSMALRDHCGLPVAIQPGDTQTLSFIEAARQCGDERGQAMACFATPSADIGAVLLLPPGLTQMLIETACGARTRSGAPKPLSPIDIALLEALLRPLAGSLGEALSFSGVETDSQFTSCIVPPTDALSISMTFRVQTEQFVGRLIIAPPVASAEAGLPAETKAAPASAQGQLTMVVTARIASLSVPLSRLSGLKPGATLLLGVPADQPVEILSGGSEGPLVAEAEIGRRGGRVALRILRRGPAIGPVSRATGG